MSPIELAATLLCVAWVVLSALAVELSVRDPVVALFGWIFTCARLYSDALLQLFYIAINGCGRWSWTRKRDRAGEVPVATRPRGTDCAARSVGGRDAGLGRGDRRSPMPRRPIGMRAWMPPPGRRCRARSRGQDERRYLNAPAAIRAADGG